MLKRALIFFPHNPYPPRTGAHKRCLEVINGLQQLEYEVTLMSSDLFTETRWTDESIKSLNSELGVSVSVYEGSAEDWDYVSYTLIPEKEKINFSAYAPPGLCRRFREFVDQLSPDLIMVNYAYWGALSVGTHVNSVLTILDTLDLVTRCVRMQSAIEPYLSPLPQRLADISPDVITTDFFHRVHADATEDEFRICDQHDVTIAISEDEAKAIAQHAPHTNVHYLPVATAPRYVENSYADPPIFVCGNNLFNLQGYYFFIKKVLPQLLNRHPDFCLRVIGMACKKLFPTKGTALLGYVDDLEAVYAQSKFAICPLIGGTGQQIKVVEAMAHGIPVVILRNVADSSPVEHGVNGFIANDADEFIEYTSRLYNSPDLCRQMGIAARETVAKQCSDQQLISALRNILSSAEKRSPEQKCFPKIVVDGLFFQINQTGIARVWRSLFEEWVKTGFAEHLVVLDRGGTTPEIPGIRRRLIQPLSYAKTALDAQMLQTICDEEDADLFISTYYTAPTSTPSVFMGYDMIPEVLGLNTDEATWLEKRYGILHACRYITISQSTADDLIRLFPQITPESVTVAHCGIDPQFQPADDEEIKAFRQKFELHKPYFIVVGERLGVDGYKNVPLLFEALQTVSWKRDVQVLCIGGRPNLESEIETLAQDIDVQRVRLSDKELKIAYSGAIALVYPSLYEGFGLPVAEAMACGCPVITCKNSSITEVGGDAALYVSPSDPMEMARALDSVRSPNIRETMKQSGFKQVQQFSWAQMATTVEQALKDAAHDIKHDDVKQTFPIWEEFRQLQYRNQRSSSSGTDPSSLALSQEVLRQKKQLQTIRGRLKSTREQLKAVREELVGEKEALQSARMKIDAADQELAAVKSSKFWKLRSLWLRVKKKAGLTASTHRSH